jgi:predicted nucleic acid-binding protein
MTERTLVDAGPLVAFFNARDRDHERCVNVLRGLRHPLLTTWPPLAEASHLLDFARSAQLGLLEMIERGALELALLDADDVAPIRALMAKYADLPMDLADATLVRVAARDRIGRVFTLDRRDFSVYRLPGRRRLTIVP